MPLHANPRIGTRAALGRQGPPGDPLGALGISQGELSAMQQQIAGAIVLPGFVDYALDSEGNPLFPAQPRIIVKAASESDVATALGWAHDNDWWTVLRSGGHSTAGFSLNDGMVLDVSGLDTISIDTAAKTATIGAGANWGAINVALNGVGLHVPGGGCPTVGVAGYMQGGGYGFTSREFGMNCDRVREFRIMLQNGATVTANETKNPDLFWAVRGGTGGNFGVLLDVTYELVALQNMWGFALRWPIEDGAAALEELQANWMGAAGDPRVSYQVAIANTEVTSLRLSGNSVVMMGMYDGTRVAGQKAIASLQKVGSPALVYDKASTYDVLNEDLISVLRGVPQQPGWTTYELKRCGYIAASLTPGDWETVLDAYAAAPNQWDIIGIEPYGGAITNPTRPNAFIHRNVSMDFFIDSFYSTEWTGNGAHRAQRWIDDVMTTMQPYFNGEVYQNYPWRGLADFEKAYWGTGYPRLQKVKLAADKDGFFHFEQGITPASPGSGDEGQIVIEADPS